MGAFRETAAKQGLTLLGAKGAWLLEETEQSENCCEQPSRTPAVVQHLLLVFLEMSLIHQWPVNMVASRHLVFWGICSVWSSMARKKREQIKSLILE